jgi:phosphoribosyl-AMP cyclohydrolase
VAAFWSTSRDELWVKGATSGDTLQVVEVCVNCEQNSLLYLVRPLGAGACHTKTPDGQTRMSCYYRRIVAGRLEVVTS